ncbi:MAG: histidine--tRNA ligase [Bacteroidetes bacterium]|nr:histidine--tRNA ligase [Bacteroidota bacterium]
MADKPAIPKGTRDFNPTESVRRNYIFDTVKRVFTLYGYAPIETPAMENLSTLLGKYGAEGDKLLFKILNSGDFLAGMDHREVTSSSANVAALKICEKGLRYDLTVPFARFVVQHQHELVFPFKRYQLQPVWRADRPQRGRYREFFQCDVDVVGSDSLLYELELLQIVDEVFKSFDTKVCIYINHRKILSGIAEMIGRTDLLTDITAAMDKLDRIGWEGVETELIARGLGQDAVEKVRPILLFRGGTEEKIALITQCLAGSATGMAGIEELKTLFEWIRQAGIGQEVVLDLSLARGLNYYTGAIFEVKALDYEMGSICGGGRYDNLTGIFGLPGISGVGISFGADRIYDVLLGLDKFPASTAHAPKVLFMNLGREESVFALSMLKQLRSSGIAGELYPEQVKMKKQFDYADKRGIPYVAIIGEGELKQAKVSLKELKQGQQQMLTPDELKKYLEKE